MPEWFAEIFSVAIKNFRGLLEVGELHDEVSGDLHTFQRYVLHRAQLFTLGAIPRGQVSLSLMIH